MRQKKVAIIIPTRNKNHPIVKDCIKSLKTTAYKNYKIFLIEDVNGEGFAISCNKGMMKATSNYQPDYYLILNDDTLVYQKDWLKIMIKEAENLPRGGIFGCQLIYPDESLQWFVAGGDIVFFKEPGQGLNRPYGFSSDYDTIENVSEVIGAFMLIKKEVIKNISYFDDDFSPFYGEESDYCFRARKAGWDCVYVGTVKFIHLRDQTISKINPEYRWFVQKKNSIHLERKHYNLAKQCKYGIIHFGSVFKNDGVKRKFPLLLKAYQREFEHWWR